MQVLVNLCGSIHMWVITWGDKVVCRPLGVLQGGIIFFKVNQWSQYSEAVSEYQGLLF